MAAATLAGQLWVQVTAPAGQSLPNYCGGPGFGLDFVNNHGVTVAARPQPVAEYCAPGTAPTQAFTFSVPVVPGRYTVHVTVYRRTPAATRHGATIPPTLTIAVNTSGLASLP
ncbi:MAG: hypothetical protein ACYDEA_03080 [Candidatus Dormibacteria bacterium]